MWPPEENGSRQRLEHSARKNRKSQAAGGQYYHLLSCPPRVPIPPPRHTDDLARLPVGTHAPYRILSLRRHFLLYRHHFNLYRVYSASPIPSSSKFGILRAAIGPQAVTMHILQHSRTTVSQSPRSQSEDPEERQEQSEGDVDAFLNDADKIPGKDSRIIRRANGREKALAPQELDAQALATGLGIGLALAQPFVDLDEYIKPRRDDPSLSRRGCLIKSCLSVLEYLAAWCHSLRWHTIAVRVLHRAPIPYVAGYLSSYVSPQLQERQSREVPESSTGRLRKSARPSKSRSRVYMPLCAYEYCSGLCKSVSCRKPGAGYGCNAGYIQALRADTGTLRANTAVRTRAAAA
ncbi:hypothetical protein DFH08DRAFT_934530 [Mycena albidolilacea]|uniref:Uncharacterized protein n=1 Tax=Mycena albidolilacea TaxID=1033008 RepID=A0AAD7A8C6_9AGAR|nr:hypothetical protein DFH08DRAFT_934530 [Mycena albidolilacea]